MAKSATCVSNRQTAGGRVQGRQKTYCPCSRGETPVSRALLRRILNYLPKRVCARMSAEYSLEERLCLCSSPFIDVRRRITSAILIRG